MLHQNKGKTIHPYMDSFNHIFSFLDMLVKLGKNLFIKSFSYNSQAFEDRKKKKLELVHIENMKQEHC